MTAPAKNPVVVHHEAFVKLMGAEGIHGWLLKHGREWAITKDTFKGRRAKQGRCYANAFHLAVGDPSLTYVEGHVSIFGGICIEHAWVVDADGNVIDPTIKKGDDGHVDAYFGVPFNDNYVVDTALKTKVYGVVSFTNPDILDDDPEVVVAKVGTK